MKTFIKTLGERYASIVRDKPMDPDQARSMTERLNALRLAEAALTKLELNQRFPEHVPHVGIIGPTQSGKSTVVNLLLDSEAAGVSALAGYTVHAQGFTLGAQSINTHHSDQLFHDFTQVTQSELKHEHYEQYSVTDMPDSESSPLAPATLWDSPDFDSIESGSYRHAVLRVAALADVHLFVISKDKYGDKSVWDLLSLLQPLGKPTLVCINKLNVGDEALVTESFLQRYLTTVNAENAPGMIALPYIKGLDGQASQLSHEQGAELRSSVARLLQTRRSSDSHALEQAGVYRLLQHHWDNWTAPVHEENGASQIWSEAVEQAMQAAMARYHSGYLEHPQKYDTLKRALAELLNLLEIPGLASTLGKTRQLVTWPVRKIFSLGQSAVQGQSTSTEVPSDLEDNVVQDAVQHALSQLADSMLDAEQDAGATAAWWTALSRTLNKNRDTLLAEMQEATNDYQEAFKPEIESAAKKLYANLQQQPAVLNTLRAARVSADAAAVVLAVKSGGLAASDLVLAPAMLSLTTMLTEGALGKYMNSVEQDLKQLQATRVEQQLFNDVLAARLLALPANMEKQAGLFSISEQAMQQAQLTLQESINA